MNGTQKQIDDLAGMINRAGKESHHAPSLLSCLNYVTETRVPSDPNWTPIRKRYEEIAHSVLSSHPTLQFEYQVGETVGGECHLCITGVSFKDKRPQ